VYMCGEIGLPSHLYMGDDRCRDHTLNLGGSGIQRTLVHITNEATQ
jgi:hypothetical protein